MHRFAPPGIASVNSWFAGYAVTVPAMAGSLLTFLVMSAALWGAVNATYRRYDFQIPVRALPFVVAALACFALYAITGLIAENPAELPSKLQPFFLLLAVPFFVARFRGFDPARSWTMMVKYAPLGSLAGLAAFFASGSDAGGAGNQNVYGVAMTVLGMLSLTAVLSAGQRDRLLGFVGYLIAVLAVVLSETRTMLPPLLLLPVFALFLGPKLDKRWIILGGGLLLIILIALAPQISRQVMSAVDDVKTMETTEQIKPVAARIALWNGAWNAILAHPIAGYGLQNKMNVVFSLVDTKMKLPSYNHVHNEFLDAMVAGGVLALAGFLAVLLTPLRMIGLSAKSKQQDFVILGIITIFATRALTGNVMTHDLVITLFLFPLMMAAAANTSPGVWVAWRGRGAEVQRQS